MICVASASVRRLKIPAPGGPERPADGIGKPRGGHCLRYSSTSVARRCRFSVVPWEPPSRILTCFVGMPLKRVEIVQRVGGTESAGVDQAHEEISQVSAVLGLVGQRVFPVKDRHLQG